MCAQFSHSSYTCSTQTHPKPHMYTRWGHADAFCFTGCSAGLSPAAGLIITGSTPVPPRQLPAEPMSSPLHCHARCSAAAAGATQGCQRRPGLAAAAGRHEHASIQQLQSAEEQSDKGYTAPVGLSTAACQHDLLRNAGCLHIVAPFLVQLPTPFVCINSNTTDVPKDNSSMVLTSPACMPT